MGGHLRSNKPATSTQDPERRPQSMLRAARALGIGRCLFRETSVLRIC